MAYYPEFAALLNGYLQRDDRAANWLAKRVKVHHSTVSNWLEGENRPQDPETVGRIADALQLEPAERLALLTAARYARIEAPVGPVAQPTNGSWRNGEKAVPATSSPDVIAVSAPAEDGKSAEAEQLAEVAEPTKDTASSAVTASATPAATASVARFEHPWRLVIGFAGLALWLGFSYPLLWEWPMVRWIGGGLLLLCGVALWIWHLRHPLRVRKTLMRLTTHSRYAQVGSGTLFGLGLLLWAGVGLPRLYGGWPYPAQDEDGDHFGYALASGDFRGDGDVEIAVGTPGEAPWFGQFWRTGWVYLFNGTRYEIKIGGNFGQAGLDFDQPGDRFGWSFATGDFNGDYITDLAVGAPGKTVEGEAQAGCVYIFKGGWYGLTPWQRIDQHLLGHNEAGDQFGWSLAAGDFNDDGKDDLAIGAPFERPFDAPSVGYVFIYTGGTKGFTHWFGIPPTDYMHGEKGDAFGWALAAGDFNQDGVTDLAVGAPGKAASRDHTQRGRVYLIRNIPAKGPKHWMELNPPTTTITTTGNYFGGALMTADFDQDGAADLAVGAPGDLPGLQASLPVSGAVYLFRNQTGGLKLWQALAPSSTIDTRGSLFGWSLVAGNFDGDPWIDLAVGAPAMHWAAEQGDPRSGYVFTFRNDGTHLSPWQSFFESPRQRSQFDDFFGWSLTAGDFDHDGVDNLAISAPGREPHEHWVSGVVYLYRAEEGELTSWLSLVQKFDR